jgi:hypothetical protein
MPISHKHKIIFIHIPKNAGTSISTALEMSDIGHHFWSYYFKKYSNEWNSYTKIAVIRNPWERVVSCYEYSKMEESYWHSLSGNPKHPKHPDLDLLKNVSFDDCVKMLYSSPDLFKHHGWFNQSDYIFNKNRLVVNELINHKNVENKIHELTGVKIQKKNSSNHGDYKKYYNDETIKIVSKIYNRDIKIFNFKYED